MSYPLWVTLFSVLYLTSSAQAAEIPTPAHKQPIEGRVETNLRPGTDRSILMTEFWVPIAQNSDDGSVIYGDLRMMGDDQDNREFNVGVGYRDIVQTALLGEGIIGTHFWYDRRLTERGSSFNQITSGLEWFDEIWEAKINAYLPLNKDESHTQSNPNGSGSGFVGNQIVVNTDQSVVEEALPGADVEFGLKVPLAESFTDSTRIYVGGYHYQGDRANNVTGWRTRVASDITSDVQVGARFQRDDERGSQGFLDLTIRFPFGNKQSFKKQGLYARLDESPERDIDIVSNEAVIEDGSNTPILNAASGQIQNVIHVDNTAGGGGNGTIERPFNTLAAAEAIAGQNDIIYVHRGDGTTAGQNNGITINDAGQMLIGSGTNLTFNPNRFKTQNGNNLSNNVLVAATSAPVITNGAGVGVTVNGADNSFLSGFSVNGTSLEGVNIINSNNVSIQSVTATNNGRSALAASYTDGNTHTLNIDGFTGSNNVSLSLFSITTTGASNLTANLDNVNLDSAVNNSFVVSSSGTSVIDLDVDNLTTQNSTARNIWISSLNTSQLTAEINNSSIDMSGSDAVFIEAGNTSTLDMSIKNSSITNSTNNGIRMQTSNGGSLTASVLNNTIDTVTNFHGITVRAAGTGTISNFTLEDNIIRDAGNRGITIDDPGSTGSFINQGLIKNNTIENSGGQGIMIDSSVGVNITNLTFDGNIIRNGQSGIFVGSIAGSIGASFQNNLITGNTQIGIDMNDDTASLFQIDLGNGIFGSVGNNSIFSNGAQELKVDLDGSTLSAENNWWGVSTGLAVGEAALVDGSSVDADPFLTTAP